LGDLGVVGKATLKLSSRNSGGDDNGMWWSGVTDAHLLNFEARYTRPGRYAAVENAHYAH